jgi:HCOMODA/2-hydroxy-3-carboxy-muconic semialdehyde decarboxylase
MIHPARLAIATVALALAAGLGSATAQTPPTSAAVDPARIEDLVAANRILAEEGVLDAYGHVSIRHPSDPTRYLMSRSLAPILVTASDIVEYDLDSNPIDPQGRRSVIERFIHGEIYKLRPDVNAVIHSHSPAVIPFGILKRRCGRSFTWPRSCGSECPYGIAVRWPMLPARRCWCETPPSADPLH